jgi:pantoate--beta-alanine ligase
VKLATSRNANLSTEQREIASQLNVALREVADKAGQGKAIAFAEAHGRGALLRAGFTTVDYVAVRDAETLAPIEILSRPARVLAAAKIGATRLIDNLPI